MNLAWMKQNRAFEIWKRQHRYIFENLNKFYHHIDTYYDFKKALHKYELQINGTKGIMTEEYYKDFMQFYISVDDDFNRAFNMTKRFLKGQKIENFYCNFLLDFYIRKIHTLTCNSESWQQIKELEEQFDLLAQWAMTSKNTTIDVIEKIAWLYTSVDSNMYKIRQWKKYLEDHDLSQYKEFFYTKIITNRNRTSIDDCDAFNDYPFFCCFIDQVIPQINNYYRNENFYDCLLKHYIKKTLLCGSKKEIDNISNKVYELFEEFEIFQGADCRKETKVFEDESNDEIRLHAKNFYKNLFDFYTTKVPNIDKALEIGEYVVWDLNMNMDPGFYSDLAIIYSKLITNALNGEKILHPDMEQKYFQRFVELNEKINANSDFIFDNYHKRNLFENTYEDLMRLYYHKGKFLNIINAFKNLSKDNKNTTCIFNMAVNAYIAGNKSNDDSLPLNEVTIDVGSNKTKEFYEKIALHYAHQGHFKKASLYCKIALDSCCLNEIDKNELKELYEDLLI